MTQRFVITGTGRCGTYWASKVLQAGGIKCGHQAVFRHANTLGRPVEWGDYEGDSSYEAAPLLYASSRDVTKVVLVREPMAVMRSWLSIGVFVDRIDTWERWGLLSRVLDRVSPGVLRHDSPIGRAALYWHEWQRMAAFGDDVTVLRIEDASAWDLFFSIGRVEDYHYPTCDLAPVADDIPRGTWSGGPHSWSDIPVEIREIVRSTARVYGYGENP